MCLYVNLVCIRHLGLPNFFGELGLLASELKIEMCFIDFCEIGARYQTSSNEAVLGNQRRSFQQHEYDPGPYISRE